MSVASWGAIDRDADHDDRPADRFRRASHALGAGCVGHGKDSHLTLPLAAVDAACNAMAAARFDLASMRGAHGIGHTRMATESAVTPQGAHPFSTGSECGAMVGLPGNGAARIWEPAPATVYFWER